MRKIIKFPQRLPSAQNCRFFSFSIRQCNQEGNQFTQSQYLSTVNNTINNIAHQLEDMSDEGLFGKFEEDHGEIDVTNSDGVLNIKCGDRGTFVISRQTPSHQLWLSSPVSGPWHYSYEHTSGEWKCTKKDLNFFDRMDKELSLVLNMRIQLRR